MKQIPEIDFVVTWVDDTDPVWLARKAEYDIKKDETVNSTARYRDWETLKYWFRGVEKFAPWVRNVYFVTDNQKPDWLNIDNPKLKWVKHTDYIPSEYLPTFNSQPIELNLHRIKGLSDRFVYFNDDVFLINKTKPEDFFKNGLPCDLPRLGVLYPTDTFSQMMFNDIKLLNKHFSLKKSIKENPIKWVKHQPLGGIFKLFLYGRRDLIPNSINPHIHTSFLKKTFEEVWNSEFDLLNSVSHNRFRTRDDIIQYVIRDWQLFKGEFEPQKPIGKVFMTSSMAHTNELLKFLKNRKGKVICINDTEKETNFEEHKKVIIAEFEKIFPEKSSFEI